MPLINTVLKNSIWNLMGLVFPLFSAILAIPILIKNIGSESFGILSLIWVFIGYFSLFDLGLGRAVTKLVSELDHRNSLTALQSLCMTSLLVAGIAGIVGCCLVLFFF